MGRDIRDIQTLIEDAFVGIQRDDGCTLHQSQFSDTFGDFDISDEEWNRLRDAERFRDPETDWRDVPAASLQQNAIVAFLEYVRDHPRDKYRSKICCGSIDLPLGASRRQAAY